MCYCLDIKGNSTEAVYHSLTKDLVMIVVETENHIVEWDDQENDVWCVQRPLVNSRLYV